ncbi:unnamed protein product [Didymodactylos carnosus]|uniref:Uncharacterized protein n=1 Tax=Didymodactylos carnosus TaxID=1234261 RepID=A0A814XR92_9BILA|nr:unnamed protein product [Didymodactylos carnosus]CAF3982884.1 unnamed protein product [Didymodactylos carnosus]
MKDNAPFYNKGRGRSIMASDFLVMHKSGPFFSLTNKEFQLALKKYPELNDSFDVKYEQNTVSGTINVGGDNYFDNDSILKQFRRLFQMLPFKEEYKYHGFVCLVDNARTHTAAEFSVNDFGLKAGTRCPVETIQFFDDKNQKHTLQCYDDDGVSKGLLQLAHDLNIFTPNKVKLPELKALLAEHPAFKNVSKLEKLATEYAVKIIFGPKYHCETNPIEDYWCHSKQFIRKHTDQSFTRLNELLPLSKDHFIEKQIHLKLFRRIELFFYEFFKLINNLADSSRTQYQAIGQLYVVGPLSYEARQSYTLVLFAFDTLNLATITVIINLLLQNIRAPSTIRFENGHWYHTSCDKDRKGSGIERYIDDQGQQQIVLTCDKVKARRWYKRA